MEDLLKKILEGDYKKLVNGLLRMQDGNKKIVNSQLRMEKLQKNMAKDIRAIKMSLIPHEFRTDD